jgi:hypothetical protein
VKYLGLARQIAQLRAQLPRAGQRIIITGGLPESVAAAAPAEPVQLELPLPAPPAKPRGEGRFFVITPPAEASPEPPQGDLEATQALNWEQTYWRSRQRRRDQGR